MCFPISSVSIGGIIQLVITITKLDAILIGYWMEVQVRTMMSTVMYKNKFKMGGGGVLSMFLMVPCEVFLRSHMRSAIIIALLGSGRGICVGLRYSF